MKTNILYPILFRAHPGRTAGPKDVLVPYLHQHDVPDVSRSETEVAFKSQKYTLLEYDGRLFSHVGKPGSPSADACFGLAFGNEDLRQRPWWIPTRAGDRAYIRYAGQPLDNMFYYRLYLDGGEKARETVLWPALTPEYRSHQGGPMNRNDFTFQGLENKIRDIDADQFRSARNQHAAEGDRLIVVDGSYWIEATPPALCVTNKGRMVVELAHVPNWLDRDLGRQYFSISAREEALEYARRAQPITEYKNRPIHNLSASSELRYDEANPLFAFDHAAYSVQRTTFLLGGDLARAMAGNPSLEERIGPAKARSVLEAKAAARACGTDYRTWPDAAELVHDVTEAWIMTGRKPGWAEIPKMRHEFGTMICERAVAMTDALPIVVPANTQWTPSP